MVKLAFIKSTDIGSNNWLPLRFHLEIFLKTILLNDIEKSMFVKIETQ